MLKYNLSKEMVCNVLHSILQKIGKLTGINLFGVGGQTVEILTVWRDNERLLECPVVVTYDIDPNKMKINEQDLSKRIEELVGEVAPATNMIFGEDELLIFSVLYWKNKTKYDNAFTVTVGMLLQQLTEKKYMKTETQEEPESLEKRVSDLEEVVSMMTKTIPDIANQIKEGAIRDELCLQAISGLTDRFKWLCEGLGSQK